MHHPEITALTVTGVPLHLDKVRGARTRRMFGCKNLCIFFGDCGLVII